MSEPTETNGRSAYSQMPEFEGPSNGDDFHEAVRQEFAEINDEPTTEAERRRQASTLEAIDLDHMEEIRRRLRVTGRIRTK